MIKSKNRHSASRQLRMGEQLEDRCLMSADPLIFDADQVGWASVRNMSSTEFAADFAARKDTQILTDIEVDEVNGQQRVSGIWQDNVDNRGWAEHRNLSSSEFSDKWNLYRDNGYRLVDQESYTLGGTRYYAGIWVENGEHFAWASYRNLTSAEFSDRFQQYKDDYLMIDFEAYAVGNSTRYAAVWVENEENLAWVERRGLTSAEFSDYFDQYKDTYRVLDVESYQVNGQQRYAAIWVENTNGRAWQEWRDMTANDYRNRWIRNRDLGYRLIDFEEYETDNGIRYAGVWRQNSDRPDWSLRTTVDTLVKNHLDDYDVPGIGVAIAYQGEIEYMRGFGYQDVANNEWYSARTVNRLASVSKAVGGVLLMDLAEQGDINPDLATRHYVPEMPVHQSHTLKELASNRGGVGHYSELGLGTVNTQYDTALEASELFWDKPLVAPPGTQYFYSTHGYTLLGAGIEGATGEAIGDVIENELTFGAGLPSLRVEDRSESNYYRTELYNNDNSKATPDNISWKVLGGGLEASAYDMVRFGSKLIAGQILDDDSMDELWTVPEPDNVSYALGWSVGTQQGARVVGKDGAQLGANTYIRLFPDAGLSIVVLSNRKGGGHSAGTLARDIADAILPTIPLLPGDADANGVVNGLDFLRMQRTPSRYSDSDWAAWQMNFGKSLARTGRTSTSDDILLSEPPDRLTLSPTNPGITTAPRAQLVDAAMAMDTVQVETREKHTLVDDGGYVPENSLNDVDSRDGLVAKEAALVDSDPLPIDQLDAAQAPITWMDDELLEKVFG